MARPREVWRIDRAGSLDRLARRREDLPDLAPGQARVAVKAIGLNFADIFACLGLYSATPKGSFIPGLEFAGVIESIAPPDRDEGGAPALGEGDVVIGLTRFGAYATVVNADTHFLRAVPAGWDFAEAAAYPVQALTAWYGLVTLGALEREDVVLLQSAAGGVGLNALTILASFGARTVATVGRPAKRDFLVERHGLAPERVIVRDRRSFGNQLDRALASIGARGFDLVFDAVAGPFLRPAYERLRPEGRLVVYGAADFMAPRARPNYLRLGWRYLRRPRLDPLHMMTDNRSVMGFNLIWLWNRTERLAATYTEMDRVLRAPPLVGRRFGFADAPAAMRHLQSGDSIGKVVIEV